MSASILRFARRLFVLSATLAIAASCGGSGGGGGGGGTGGSGLVDGASVTPSPIVAAQTSFPGEFAADFLRRTRFTNLLVEIDYPVGYPPSTAAMNLLQDRLSERCDKPGGVTILEDDAIPLAEFPSSLDVSDLENLENAHRDNFADSNTQTAVMYILYVKGNSSLGGGPNTQVLGLTYHGSSVALFVDVANQGNNAFETTAEVEGTAIVHEAGHVLGLVNGGCPMVVPHEDLAHTGHDSSAASCMYWLIQIPHLTPNIGDPDFAPYGANCEDDVAAAGGLPASPVPAFLAFTIGSPSVSPVGECGTCLLRTQAGASSSACPSH
jgi:hypothetical protein